MDINPNDFDLNKLIEEDAKREKETIIDLYVEGLLTDDEFDNLTLH